MRRGLMTTTIQVVVVTHVYKCIPFSKCILTFYSYYNHITSLWYGKASYTIVNTNYSGLQLTRNIQFGKKILRLYIGKLYTKANRFSGLLLFFSLHINRCSSELQSTVLTMALLPIITIHVTKLMQQLTVSLFLTSIHLRDPSSQPSNNNLSLVPHSGSADKKSHVQWALVQWGSYMYMYVNCISIAHI